VNHGVHQTKMIIHGVILIYLPIVKQHYHVLKHLLMKLVHGKKQLMNVAIQIHEMQQHIILIKIIPIGQNLKMKHVNGTHNQPEKMLIVKFIIHYMVVQQPTHIQDHQHPVMIDIQVQTVIIHSIRTFQQQQKFIH
jgi:hypothetical protein